MSINEDKSDEEYKEKYGWFEGDFKGIKSEERAKKFAEVYTPRWLAEKMVDFVEPGVSEIEKTCFEPACGEGAFLTVVLRRKLEKAKTPEEKIRCCQTCYGVDIQYDNVLNCREKLVGIAEKFGVDPWEAKFIFARNIIHGDFLFFPMIIRIYDWANDGWTTIEEMKNV